MKFEDIQALIQQFNESNIAELRIEQDDFKITLRSPSYVEAVQKSKASPMPIVLPPATPTFSQQQTVPFEAASPSSTEPTTLAEKTTPTEKSASAPPADANLLTVRSPMIGTFYRSPGPDKPPFVKIGDTITAGESVLCIVEAMKLFNEIEAEVSGKIVKILLDDASPVEYDQPLFLVEA